MNKTVIKYIIYALIYILLILGMIFLPHSGEREKKEYTYTELEDAKDHAAEDAYGEGYNDGYADGYAAGIAAASR